MLSSHLFVYFFPCATTNQNVLNLTLTARKFLPNTDLNSQTGCSAHLPSPARMKASWWPDDNQHHWFTKYSNNITRIITINLKVNVINSHNNLIKYFCPTGSVERRKKVWTKHRFTKCKHLPTEGSSLSSQDQALSLNIPTQPNLTNANHCNENTS